MNKNKRWNNLHPFIATNANSNIGLLKHANIVSPITNRECCLTCFQFYQSRDLHIFYISIRLFWCQQNSNCPINHTETRNWHDQNTYKSFLLRWSAAAYNGRTINCKFKKWLLHILFQRMIQGLSINYQAKLSTFFSWISTFFFWVYPRHSFSNLLPYAFKWSL